MIRSILLLTLVVICVNAQFFAKCPNLDSMAGFEPLKFIGKWYEITRVSNIGTYPEKDGVCEVANYQPDPNQKGHIIVENSQRIKDPVHGEFQKIIGDAYAPDPKVPSKLLVKLPIGPFTNSAPLWILDTNYDDYALVYTCIEILGIYRVQTPYILSRKPILTEEQINTLKQKYQHLGIDTSGFINVTQKDCVYEK
jgi:apolipoprotein D and lipocalin family protein